MIVSGVLFSNAHVALAQDLITAGEPTAVDPGVSSNLPPLPDACQSTSGWDIFGIECGIRWLLIYIALTFMAIGAFFATIAGTVFEFLLKNLIVEFGSFLQTGIGSAIDQWWTFFRDIANIIIIGAFLTMAGSLILGVSQFGERRYIARILIIAVLLNFSLLMTKMVVDASNFTAAQFYNDIVKKTDEGGAAAGPVVGGVGDESEQTSGIANVFMQYLGVNGAFNSTPYLKEMANGGMAWRGVVYGFVTMLLLLALSLVFLYGSYLIVLRGVSLVLLMVTSALAFASWLIPGEFTRLGWSRWWTSLMHAASLAPVLMVFLWGAEMAAKGIKDFIPGVGGAGSAADFGTLGDLVAHGSSAATIAALVNFVIILALLFAGFRVSSMLASGIAYFSVPASITGAIAGSALGLAGGLTGAVGRNTIGRWAYGRQQQASAGAQEAKAQLDTYARIKQQQLASGLSAGSREVRELSKKQDEASRRLQQNLNRFGQFGALASNRFNPTNTLAGRIAGKATGVSLGSKPSTQSFAKQQQTRAAAADTLKKQALGAAPLPQEKVADARKAAADEAKVILGNLSEGVRRTAAEQAPPPQQKQAAPETPPSAPVSTPERTTVTLNPNQPIKVAPDSTTAQEVAASDNQKRQTANEALNIVREGDAARVLARESQNDNIPPEQRLNAQSSQLGEAHAQASQAARRFQSTVKVTPQRREFPPEPPTSPPAAPGARQPLPSSDIANAVSATRAIAGETANRIMGGVDTSAATTQALVQHSVNSLGAQIGQLTERQKGAQDQVTRIFGPSGQKFAKIVDVMQDLQPSNDNKKQPPPPAISKAA